MPVITKENLQKKILEYAGDEVKVLYISNMDTVKSALFIQEYGNPDSERKPGVCV